MSDVPCAGHLLEDCLLQGVHSMEWSANGDFLLYTQPDNMGRPARVREAPEDLTVHPLSAYCITLSHLAHAASFVVRHRSLPYIWPCIV